MLTDLLSNPLATTFLGVLVLIFLLGVVFLSLPLLVGSWQMRGLAKRLRTLKQAEMEKLRAAGGRGMSSKIWKEFVDDWHEARITVGERSMSPVALEAYFVRDRLIPWRLGGLFQPLAGILLSLGILGTFIGITWGLAGIDTSAPDRLLEGVQGLLSGMHFAFASSILGLGLSILWLVGAKWIESGFEENRERLAAAADPHLPWIPAEEISAYLEEAAFGELVPLQKRQIEYAEVQSDLLDEQRGLLQTLGQDLAKALEETLRSALSDTVVPSLDGLSRQFESFAADHRKLQQEGVRTMVDEFQETLKADQAEYMDALRDAIVSSTEHVGNFKDMAEETMDSLAILTEMQKELFQSTTTATQEFRDSISGLTEIHGRIHETIGSYEKVAEELQRFSEGIRGEAETLSEANREVREALASHLESVGEQVEALTEGTRTFQGQLQEVVPQLERAVTEFTGLAADKLVEVFSEFDNQMARVTQHLGATLSSIHENVEELLPATERLHSSAQDLAKPVTQTRETLEELRDSFSQLTRRLDGQRQRTSNPREERESAP